MDDTLALCTAETPQQVQQIVVDKEPVGIVRLDETINDVRVLGLSQDTDPRHSQAAYISLK